MKVFAFLVVFSVLLAACTICQAVGVEEPIQYNRLVADQKPSSVGIGCYSLPDYCSQDCAPSCEANLCGGCEYPQIVVYADWVYLWRDRPQNNNLFYNPNRVPILNTSDFDFSPRSGIDAGMTVYRTCDFGIDVRYLWVDDYISDYSFVAPNGINYLATMPPSYLVGIGNMPANFRYVSKIQSSEVNLRKKMCRCDCLLGFRYIDFHESLEAVYRSGALVETQTWGSDRNNLYGLQGGLDALLWQSCDCKWRVNGIGKAGIYYDNINTSFETRFFDSPDLPVSSSASTAQAAFLGELGLNAAYQYNCHLAFRAGYHFMWLSGVASAGTQVPATGNFNQNPGTQIDSYVSGNASVFYHGLSAGIEVTW